MLVLRGAAKRVAGLVGRASTVRHAAGARAARRGRGLALLWHRVAPGGPSPHEVVRTVDLDLFRAQVEALGELGDVVPLGELESGVATARPRFALTFDDDYACYATHVLPVLRQLGAPATFFLSGRWLSGLGPYWWEVLEAELLQDGVDAVAVRMGFPGLGPLRLAAAIEGTATAAGLARRGEEMRASPAALGAAGAAALATAGMEIGFHTVRHPVMPVLTEADLHESLRTGRQQLADAIGQPIERFAYPHGRATEREAAAAGAAGYRSSWATGGRATGPADPPHRRPRYEAGGLPVDQFVAALLVKLAVSR